MVHGRRDLIKTSYGRSSDERCLLGFQSVTDTDNEFTECQTPKKMLQSVDISPFRLHAFMKTSKSNISEPCKVQVHCLKDSWSDFYDKNDMKENVNDLVRLHEVMQENLITTSYSGLIQILTFYCIKNNIFVKTLNLSIIFS